MVDVQEIEAWSTQNVNPINSDEIIILNNYPIPVTEVKTLLASIPEKAPGTSGIGHDLMRLLPDSLIIAITHIYMSR